MKRNSIIKKLGHFQSVTDKDGHLCFYSRQKTEGIQDRIVKLFVQDGHCIALPIFQNRESGEETVVFHAKTIKSLVVFLENK